MNNIETQLDAVTDNARENGIAPVFSTTKTYAVGEHVLYNPLNQKRKQLKP